MDTEVNPGANTDQIRLLLVDDDVNLLETISRLLYRKGYKVTPATGSDEAITILNDDHKSVDVVVTDFYMPGINGIELAGMIREISSDIPVILHTGKIDLVDKEQVVQAGINEVIIKPYKTDELDEMIRKVIKTEGGSHEKRIS